MKFFNSKLYNEVRVAKKPTEIFLGFIQKEWKEISLLFLLLEATKIKN